MSTATVHIHAEQTTVVADTVIDHIRVRLIDAAGRTYVETVLSAIQLQFPDVAPGPASVLLELISDRGTVVGISSRMINIEAKPDLYPENGVFDTESNPATITADLPALSDISFFDRQAAERTLTPTLKQFIAERSAQPDYIAPQVSDARSDDNDEVES